MPRHIVCLTFDHDHLSVTAANTVAINSTAGFTIDGAVSYALSAQWAVVELESDGTQWLVI